MSIQRKYVFTAVCVLSGSLSVQAFAGAPNVGDLTEADCQVVSGAANQTFNDNNQLIDLSQQAITGGSDRLDAMTCIDSLRNIDINFFDSFNDFSLGGLINSIKDQAQSAFDNMVCDFANNLKGQAENYLSCSAQVGLNATVGAGGLPQFNAEACYGQGNLDYSLSKDVSLPGSGAGQKITVNQTVTPQTKTTTVPVIPISSSGQNAGSSNAMQFFNKK